MMTLTPSLALTDESCDGARVLITRPDGRAYGPRDCIEIYSEPPQPAALVVHRLGQVLQGEQREAAKEFLNQWPEGPQLDTVAVPKAAVCDFQSGVTVGWEQINWVHYERCKQRPTEICEARCILTPDQLSRCGLQPHTAVFCYRAQPRS